MTPEALARLHAECFRVPPPWSAADFRSLIADPSCVLLVRTQAENLLAFVLFRLAADEAELLTLATAPGARRGGHARSLLDEGLDTAAARGAHACFLEVAATNLAARNLYESLGFRQVGRRTNYYHRSGHAPIDALVYKALVRR